MAGGKIKGISKKEGGDIKKFEWGQRTQKERCRRWDSSVAAPFHFEAPFKSEGNEPAAMYA